MCWSIFVDKSEGWTVADWTQYLSLKKSFWHNFFPIDFAKFLRTIFFLQNKQLRGPIKNHRCFFYFLFDIILFSHFDGKNYNHQTILINILPGKSIKGLQI